MTGCAQRSESEKKGLSEWFLKYGLHIIVDVPKIEAQKVFEWDQPTKAVAKRVACEHEPNRLFYEQPLAVVGFLSHTPVVKSLGGEEMLVGWVLKSPLAHGEWDQNSHFSARAKAAIDLPHDSLEIGQVLKHVIHQYRFGLPALNRPGKLVQVEHQIGANLL